MRRMKKWAAVLLAVSLVAGNMPAAYVQADGYNNIAQVFEHKDEEMSETEEQQAEGSAEKQESEPKMQEPEEPEMQESKAPAQEEARESDDRNPIPVEHTYTCHGNFTITKTWNDSQNPSGRPEDKESLLELYYVMLPYSAAETPVTGYKEFTEANTENDFGKGWWKNIKQDASFPAPEITENGSAWTYSYPNILPEQMTVTEEGEQQVYNIYYAVKEADWSGKDQYTLSGLKEKKGSWVLENGQMNAYEEGDEEGLDPTLKTAETSGGEDVVLTNTRCKEPFTVTIHWKDNSNTYMTRPGSHKAGDLYNYQLDDGIWTCKELTENEAADLNEKELAHFKEGLVLKAKTGAGADLPVENAQMEITGLDADTWTLQISHLPAADEDGHQLAYYLEYNHQDGISANNVPNSSENNDPRILENPGGEYKTSIVNEGVDTGDADAIYSGSEITNTIEKNIWFMFRSEWEDEGADKEDRPSPTIYLYRAAEENGDKTIDFGRLHPVPGYDSKEVPRDEDATIEIGYENHAGVLPLYDSNGRRYTYYAIVNVPNAGDYVQLITNQGNYGDQALIEANKEGYLLGRGTLTLRRQAQVSLTATKTFVVNSMQDIHTINNVSVTLMLQKCEDGENWENVQEADGSLVTRELTGFRGEKLTIPSDRPYTASKYNEKGAQIQYRWVETSMNLDNQSVTAENGAYFKENEILTPTGKDGTVVPMAPGAGGQDSTAHFMVIYNDDGSVTNRLIGNTEVTVTKDWAQTGWGADHGMSLKEWLETEEGAAYKDHTITFRLIRNDGKTSISEGAPIDGKTLCRYTLDEDGTVVGEVPLYDITIKAGETLTAEDSRNIWNYLPRYDENSEEYQYQVEELYDGNAPWKTSKTYTTKVVYDESDDDYYVQRQVHFINSSSGGEMTFRVGKVWLDNGDLICRKPLTIALYHKDIAGNWSQVKGIGTDGADTIILDNSDNWFRKFSIQAVNGDVDYKNYLVTEVRIGDKGAVHLLESDPNISFDKIAERSMDVPISYNGTDSDYIAFFGGKDGESAETVAERQKNAVIGKVTDENGSTGLNHNYNVYLGWDQQGTYTIYNQRTGTANMNIAKIWKTGSDLNEAAVLAITQNGKQVAWLKLDKAQNSGSGYSNSWESGTGTVLTVESAGTGIPEDTLEHYNTSALYRHGNYPKYDGMGKLYRYGIEEAAILNRTSDSSAYTVTVVDQNNKKGNQVLATVEMRDGTDADAETIYHDYTISKSLSVTYADHPSETDLYTCTVTNTREQMLTLMANKVWQDDGSDAADTPEKRPDITFTLYRTTKYKSAEELLKVFDHALGKQQDMTNIPRAAIENAQKELVKQSDVVEINGKNKFLWNTKQNDWYWVSSRFTGNERYDEDGNPYIYFLIETIPHNGFSSYNGEYHTRYDNAHMGSSVNGTTITAENANTKLFTPQSSSQAVSTDQVFQPNYLDGGYLNTLSAGVLIVSDGVHSVPVKTTYQNGIHSNEIVSADTEGAVQDYCSYWSHTVINYRVRTDKIKGEKIWQLPDGSKLNESYLPDVTFQLARKTGNEFEFVDKTDFRKSAGGSDTDQKNRLYVILGKNHSTNAKDSTKVTFGGKNDYAYAISDLPVYNKYGQKYIYSVDEQDLDKSYFVKGGHPANSSVSFVNYYTGAPKAKLSFTKEWSVGDAPKGSSFTLNPQKGTITVTTNERETTTSLPASLTFKMQGYFTGPDGQGRKEIASAAYTATVKAVYNDSGYTLSGEARCDGGDQDSGSTVPKITVTQDTTENASGITWKVELSNLKSLAPDGSKIIYEVTETVPDGYESSSQGATELQQPDGSDTTPVYSGQTFLNVYTGKKMNGAYTSVTVQKKWEDKGYDRMPEEITLKLYRKNAAAEKNPENDVLIADNIGLKKDNNWTAAVGKDPASQQPTLPVYAPDGQKYAYYLTEITEDPNYILTGSNYSYGQSESVTVTATNTLPTGQIYFKKQWQTQVEGQTPADLTNERDFDRLLNLGALPIVTLKVQYQDQDGTWTDLERSSAGKVQVTYNPKTDPDKYKKALFRSQIAFTVPLYKTGTNSAGESNENYQKYRIVETAEFADGQNPPLGSNTIMAGTEASTETTSLITNKIPVVQVEIIKHWEDNDDRDGMRPDTLSTYIQTKTSAGKWKKMEEIAKPASNITETTVSDEEKQTGNTYTTGIMLLPKNHQDLKITEADIAGYTASDNDPAAGSCALSDGTPVATYTFTNTYAPKLFQVSAEKQWNDEDNKYSLRNEDGRIDLTLWYRPGDTGEWKKVTTAAKDQILKYTVHGREKIYYSDSQAVHTTTTLNADNSLTCTPGTPAVWENLPANAAVNGNTVTVQYKITESGDNKAYTGTASSTDGSAFDGIIQFKGTDGGTQNFRITNTLQTTSLTIHKEWKQEEQVTDEAGYRPDEIRFQVEYRAGTDGEWNRLPGDCVTLSKSGQWTETLTGLPVCGQDGNKYEYRVSEVSLTYRKLLGIISNTDQVSGSFHTETDGTETWTGDAGRYLTKVTTTQQDDGSFIASAENTLVDRHHQFSIEVSKQWEDGENRFGLRPDHNGAVLKLQYSLDDGTTWSDITKAELNWDNCYEDNGGVHTTSEPCQTAVAASQESAASPARWEHLPGKVLVNGRSHLVQYQVREADYPAYSAEIGPEQIAWEESEGEVRTVQVVNTLKTTSFSIRKEWTGEEGIKGASALRPEKVEVKLEYAVSKTDPDWNILPSGSYVTADGKNVMVDENGLLTLSAKDNWEVILTGLPVCDAEGQAYVYRATELRLLYKDGQTYTVKDGDAGRYRVFETTVQDADGTWKAVLTNQLVDRYQARITKHAETLDGPVLEGAGYVLYRPKQMDYYTGKDASGNAVWGIWNDAKILYTGSDGTAMISGLPRGSYQFVEVAAAKGYRIDSTPMDFTIGDDNIGMICEVHQADERRSSHKHSGPSGEEPVAGRTISELKPVGPPRTGDSNDWRIYAGMSAGLLAVIAVLLRKLKNH